MAVGFSQVPGGSFTFNDGNSMPRIGLGVARIKTQESLTISVRAALKAGYRMFDTAHIYENEKELGVALKECLPEFGLDREAVFITTKVAFVNEDVAGFVAKSVEESLEKLQTDYLDLVLCHFSRDCYTGNDDDERNAATRKVVPVLNQCEYHPYLTRKLLKRFCEHNKIVFQAYSSLCYGNQDVPNEPAVQRLAAKYEVTPQHILYAFAFYTNAAIIPKSAAPSRIESNLHETIKARVLNCRKNQMFLIY